MRIKIIFPELFQLSVCQVTIKTMTGFFLVVLMLASSNGALADQEMPFEQLPQSWKADAELTDVFFLNPNMGWAVGAQGVILRTTNGGRSWIEISRAAEMVGDELTLEQKLKNMRTGTRTRFSGVATGSASSDLPVRYRFESVHFVDEKHGWIAGGYEAPYIDRSRAIMMRTNDGGLNWESVRSLVIPRINKIHFSDHMNGWAVGKSSNLFPTGLFHTSNGGSTWSSVSSTKLEGWTSAEKTSQGMVTLNYEGRLGVFRSQHYDPAVVRTERIGRINQLRMIDNQNGLAVGANGVLLRTNDGGLSWSKLDFTNEKNVVQMVKQFDLRTLALTSTKFWLAGDPGTFLFSIDRKTGAADFSRLPTRNRINKLVFADDQFGWAVGSFGTILATADGGANWTIQRGTNSRVALLAVSPDAQNIPHEVFSKYGSEENSLVASLLLSGTIQEHQITDQATERLGNVISDLIAADKNDLQQKLQQVVRVIRTWQPAVIVCNASDMPVDVGDRNSSPVGLIRDAIRKAADRNAFPEQLTLAGLKTWQVKRLAMIDPTGNVTIDPRQLLPRTGKLMEDQIALSRAITGQPILPGPGSVFRVAELATNSRPKAGNLLVGLSGATVPNRFRSNEKHGNLVAIQQASTKQKTFEQFVKFEANTAQDFVVWRQKVQTFAMKMDSDVAGVWLMQLAERYLAAGKTELAAGSAEMLVTRWSGHAFEPTALWWLANYYASDEFGQIEFNKRIELGLIGADGTGYSDNSDNEFDTAPALIPSGSIKQLVWVPTNTPLAKKSKANDSQKPKTLVEARSQFLAQRHLKAGRFLKQLGRRDPELVSGSQFRMMDIHLAKRIQGSITNEGRWQALAKLDPQGVGLSAHRELVLNGFTGFAGLQGQMEPILSCTKTETRPKLDGILDDPCWRQAARAQSLIENRVDSLRAMGARSNTHSDPVVFAFDNEFLFVGVVCQKLPGHYYNSRKKARTRDADLQTRDRIEISIDVDRDYRSAFKLVVDHRGWVNESCCGSAGWNPNWYVSQSENESSWTIEFAIPLEELARNGLDASTVWALQLERRVFDGSDIWNKALGSSEDKLVGNHVSGLQLGLKARPQDFRLLRFGMPTSPVSHQEVEVKADPIELKKPTEFVPTETVPNFTLPASWNKIPNLREAKGQFVSPEAGVGR